MNKQHFGKLKDHGKMYGTTTVGSRGQVVIPAAARKDLKLKAGDQLLVMGRFGKVLGLVKAEQFSSFVNAMMEHIEDPQTKEEVKQQINTFIKKSKLSL